MARTPVRLELLAGFGSWIPTDQVRYEEGLMMGLGLQELLVILGIVVLIFGGKKAAELGKGLGEGIRNFKRGISDRPPAKEDE